MVSEYLANIKKRFDFEIASRYLQFWTRKTVP